MQPHKRLIVGLAVVGATLVALTTVWGASFAKRPTASTEVPVTAMDVGVGWANNSPQVVAHPANRLVIMMANRVDGPKPGCGLHMSSDGGRLWAPLHPVVELPEGVDACYAPEIGFDGRGQLYFLFIGLAGAGNNPVGAFLTSSGDNGAHFDEPRKVLGPSNYQVRLAVDPHQVGRLWLVWLAASSDAPIGGFPAGANPILAERSDDGGASFSTPVQVNDDSRPRSVAPAAKVGADHRLRVAYYDLGDDARDYQGLAGPTYEGTWSVVLTISNETGTSFRHATVVAAAVVPPGRPPLVYTMAPPALALGRGGQVYVAWADARHGDADVLVAHSYDDGRRFPAPVRANDDAVGDGRGQYLPALGVAGGGRVDVVFFDRGGDRAYPRHDVRYAASFDQGRSFAPSRRLTTESSNPMGGQRWRVPSALGQGELGSRLGVVSSPSGAVVAWPDTRNVFGTEFGLGGPIAQDVFATQVRLGSASRSSAWLLTGAAGAGGVTVLAGAWGRRRRPAA